MQMIIIFCCFAAFLCIVTAQLPDCSKPFVLTDPNTEKTYSYDLSKATVTNASSLLYGMEGTLLWVLHVNICGNAAIQKFGTTCSRPTPNCLIDGRNGYDCGGVGVNNSNYAGTSFCSVFFSPFLYPSLLLVGPYYEPSNPNQFYYDRGVVIVSGGGDGCDQNTISRSTTLWLKCNPAASTIQQIGATKCTMPDCIDVTEPSICQYVFAPVEWKGFCPENKLSSVSVVKGTVCTAGENGSTLSVETMDPASFLSTFKKCTCGPSDQCSSLYHCSCDASAKQCTTARISSVTFFSNDMSGTWSSQPVDLGECFVQMISFLIIPKFSFCLHWFCLVTIY